MKHCTRLVWKAQIDEAFFSLLNQRAQVYNECWNKWVAVCCFLTSPLLPLHTRLGPLGVPPFCLANSGLGSVLPAEDSSFFSRSPLAGSASPHRKARAAVLLKGETDYVFRRPTQASHHQHHSEAWRRPELEH